MSCDDEMAVTASGIVTTVTQVRKTALTGDEKLMMRALGELYYLQGLLEGMNCKIPLDSTYDVQQEIEKRLGASA